MTKANVLTVKQSDAAAATMLAVRLHGPRDLRVEQIDRPAAPGPGMALLRVTAVGICGSDLHTSPFAACSASILSARSATC